MSVPTWDSTVPTWEGTTPASDQPTNDSMLQQAGSYLQNKAVDFAADYASPSIAANTIANDLPMKGAMIGGALLPGAGVPLGAGTGQIAKRMIGIATGAQPPAGTPMQEATGPMLQAGLAGAFELTPVQEAVQSGAQNLGRRALGIGKGMIKRFKGGVGEANQAAQEMLDQGVIRPFSGAKATLDRAEEVAARSGQAVGDALSKTGQQALNTDNVASEVINQLAPKFKGGAYDAQEKVVSDIVDTISAHGKGDIDFNSAQQLKNTLKQMAGSNWNTDKIKAGMYQRAYGIVSHALENSVQNASASNLPNYLANKATYGASQKAIAGLEDRVAGEASNSMLSLRGATIGAGALAAGHIAPALEAMGAWEAVRRVGTGTGASALNFMNNSPISQTTRQALISKFVDLYLSNKNK